MRNLVHRVKRLLQHRAGPLVIGQFATAGTAFIVNVGASSVMSPEDRGVLAFVIQVSYVLTTLGLLGVERPYVAVVNGSLAGAITDLNRLTVWRHLLWMLAAGGILIALLNGDRNLAIIALLGAGYVSGNFWVRFMRSAYISSGSTLPYLVSIVGGQALLLLLALVLTVRGVDLPAVWLGAYVVSTGVAFVVSNWHLHKKGTAHTADPRQMRKIQRLGLRLLPASFGNTAMLRSDRLLLPALASTGELGRYATVATIMEIANWPVQQWVDTSLRKWASNDTVRPTSRFYGKVVGAVSVGVALMGGVAYAFVTFALPSAYSDAVNLILPLGVGTVFYSVSRIQQGRLIARGAGWSVSRAELMGMGASIALYFVLIPSFGGFGAAVASTLGYAVCTAAAGLAIKKLRKAETSGA